MLSETLELIRKDRGSWPATARATGLKREWIVAVANGRIKDPGIRKIARIHAYLLTKYGTP